MKRKHICLAVSLCLLPAFSSNSSAQDREGRRRPASATRPSTRPSPTRPTAKPSTELLYVIRLTEFRWKSEVDQGFESAADLLQRYDELKKDSNFEHLQTLRFSALENTESLVQHGQETTVTVGVQQVGPGKPQRITKTKEIGTIARVRFAKQDDRILIDLDYEATRFIGEGTDISPPDTLSTKFQTTLAVEPGKPTFVAGKSGAESSYLILTLEQ